MSNCPCCSNSMLRHIRHQQIYWFCRQCWQEMPLLDQTVRNLSTPSLETHLRSLNVRRSLVSA